MTTAAEIVAALREFDLPLHNEAADLLEQQAAHLAQLTAENERLKAWKSLAVEVLKYYRDPEFRPIGSMPPRDVLIPHREIERLLAEAGHE